MCLPFIKVNLGDFKNQIGESSSNTFDHSEREHDFSLSVDVGVLDSKNVLELCGSLHNDGTLKRSRLEGGCKIERALIYHD